MRLSMLGFNTDFGKTIYDKKKKDWILQTMAGCLCNMSAFAVECQKDFVIYMLRKIVDTSNKGWV